MLRGLQVSRPLIANMIIEVQDCGTITDHFRGPCEIYSKLVKENLKDHNM